LSACSLLRILLVLKNNIIAINIIKLLYKVFIRL
jgi:hypothetical protein